MLLPCSWDGHGAALNCCLRSKAGPYVDDALMLYRVRHEAGEALGAIGTPECLQLLESYQADPCLEVAQTCQLALQRIQHYSRPNTSTACTCGQPSSTGGAAGSCQAQSSALPVAGAADMSRASQPESGSPYLSVDPAPAAPAGTPMPELRATLLDEHAPIFERYQALFSLRNRVCLATSLPVLPCMTLVQTQCCSRCRCARNKLHSVWIL